MRNSIIIFIIGGILGITGGFGLGIFVYPYVFLADVVATEEVMGAEDMEIVATGTFIHANPSDPIHYGMGSVTVYNDVVHLEKDFKVGPGPKFHVYLVTTDNVTSSADVDNSSYVDLGRLHAFQGSQNYPVPQTVTLSDYGSVVIWCEQFGVLISPAALAFGDKAGVNNPG
ncbi:MAG: DM13 domain-containing protein [Gammaproteobacteria bacterium]|jgi:ABC-type antimicrobial peptide transport system permease subunit